MPFSLSSRLVPSMVNATDSRSLLSASAVRYLESVIAPSTFVFQTNFISKIAACDFLLSSSLDSHQRRTYPVGSIPAWTDRSQLLLEWHPTKPYSSSNSFASVDEMSASAVRNTCA